MTDPPSAPPMPPNRSGPHRGREPEGDSRADQPGKALAWEKGVVLTATEMEGCAPTADWSRWISQGRAPSSTPDSGPWATTGSLERDGTFAEHGSLAEDLHQLAGLGIEAIQLTLEWARIEPQPGQRDVAAIEFRREMIGAARQLGLRVWACLVDGTLPGWFADDEGGFGDDRARSLLWPRHIDWIGETFGDLVDGWVSQREPIMWAVRRHLRAEAPPGQRDLRATANAVQAAVLADGEAWRLLRGTAPVAMYQTARTIVAQRDNVKARPQAKSIERLLWYPWLTALTEGQLVVGDLPTRSVDHLRGAFDRVIVELRPAIEVDGSGAWHPYPPEQTLGPSGWAAWPDGMAEALRRAADALGSHPIIGAGSLADVADDGRARPDHIQAVLDLTAEASRDTSVAGWWQSSPIDGYQWRRGFSLQPGLIDGQRHESPAAEAFRAYPR